MPTYEIKTNTGTFRIKTDREATQEEVKAAFESRLSERRTLPFELPEPEKQEPVPSIGEQAQTLIETGAPMAGGMIGGAAGAALTKSPAGALKGAGLGSAAGQQLAEITRPILTGKESSLLESATRTVQTGATGAVAEGAGQGILRSLQRVMAPFAKTVQGAVAPIPLKGQLLTPAQATQSRTLDILEGIAESSLGGGGRIQAFKAKQQVVIRETADEMASKFGQAATPEEVGNLLKQSVDRGREAFHAVAQKLYKNIDDLTPSPVTQKTTGALIPSNEMITQGIVNLRGFKAFASDILTKRGELPKSLSSRTGMVILKQLANLPDDTTFANAQLMRSQLLKGARSKDLADIESGLSSALAKQVDAAMEQGAGQLSGDALTAWRTANEFWKSGREQFSNQFIRTLMRSNPEKIADAIMRPGGVTLIARAKAATDPNTFQAIRGHFIRKVFQQSLDEQGNLAASKLDRMLFGRSGLGREALDRAFSPAVRQELEVFTHTLEQMQFKPTGLPGRMFIQMKQAGAATEMAGFALTFSPFKFSGLAIMLGPAAVAQAFTRPAMIRWLTTGIKLGPRSEGGIRALTQFAAAMLHPEEFQRPVKIEPLAINEE